MAVDRNKKNFRTCVLTSGLVTPAELDQAIVALWTQRSNGGSVAQVEISEQELADKLVELGRLTRYQSQQLLKGVFKLHLAQYRILELIGQGGMGQVFKAEHMIMGRVVAVKVLPRAKATPDAEASFMHEIRAQARLHHENLVQAFDAGHEAPSVGRGTQPSADAKKVYFLVSEYVPGTDLRRCVRTHGPLSMRSAATIITQAANGLGYAHEQSLIHRDVKPGNLLVTPEGKTKVSDLGLAGWLNDTDIDPRAGKIVGTADYLSPEQILTPHKVTAASDIYSLGCTLYYAVTGKVPFPGGTSRDKARRHLEDQPLHPRRLNPDLNDKFIDVIAAMMDKDVGLRTPSAAEVIRLLAPWAEDRVDAPLLETTERKQLSSELQFAPIPESEEFDGGDFAALAETDWQFEEGLSQASQGTDPFAQIEEETVPAPSDTWLAPPRYRISRETMLLGAAAMLAIGVLLVVLFHAILK